MLIWLSAIGIDIATLPDGEPDALSHSADPNITNVVETVTWDDYDPLDFR